MKTITVQAELDREYMFEIGERLGLEKDALNMFRHFNFVNVELLVDEKTGSVREAKAHEIYP